jgi:hypothetical protein
VWRHRRRLLGRDSTPTENERAIVAAMVDLVQHPDIASLDGQLFPDEGVWLGLGETLVVRRSREELSDAANWRLDVDSFRARIGPFSALELIATHEIAADESVVDVPGLKLGPHPRCTGPPIPAPDELAGLRQVSLQAAEPRSCLDWWSVDLFIRRGGQLVAVTLDLFEP